MQRLVIFICVLILVQGKKTKKEEDDEEEVSSSDAKPDPAREVRNFFDSLFKDGGQKAFKDFLRKSKKFMQEAGGKMKADEEDEDGGKEIPAAAKAFAFYMNSYNCANSKVYEEFLKKFKDGSAPAPPGEDDADDSWLKKIAKKGVVVDDTADTTVEEANANMKDLTKDQKGMLREGEAEMPLPAQLFLRYVKSKGCADKMAKNYKKFNDVMIEEIDKGVKKGTKKAAFYLSKADVVALEILD